MSASDSKTDAEANTGMNSWKNFHPGDMACYRDKKSHAKWRWGKKKGTRRARRRLDKKVIEEDKD